MREAMRCVMVQSFPRGKCEMQAVSCQTGTPLPGRASRFRRFEFDEIKNQETDGGRTRAARRLLCVSADEICRSDCLVSFPLWPSGSGALPRVPDRLARQCECETPQGTKDQEPRNQEPKTHTQKAHEPSAGADRCLEGLWVSFAAAMRVRKTRCTLLLLAVCVAKGKLGPNKYWLLAAFAVLRFALTARCDARVCWRRRLLDGFAQHVRPNRRPAFVPKSACEFACGCLWPKSPRLVVPSRYGVRRNERPRCHVNGPGNAGEPESWLLVG